jgi:hypothetical protein
MENTNLEQDQVLDATEVKVDEVNNDAKVEETKAEEVKVDEVSGEEVKQEKKVESYWKDDWRERAVKDSGLEGEEAEAAMKRLERYSSPSAMAKALVELNKKISSGEYKIPAPEDAEALARWRKDNGIPEKYEDYDLTLEDGTVIGEDSLPEIKGFLEKAHSRNIDNDAVKDIVSWYKGYQQSLVDSDTKALTEARDSTVRELREEWGSEFEGNMNAVKSFMVKNFGDDLTQSIEHAIGLDGISLGSNPKFVRAMSELSREMNIGDYIVPGAVNKMEAIEDEMKTIEKKMGTTNYTPADRKRYTELTEGMHKLQNRR